MRCKTQKSKNKDEWRWPNHELCRINALSYQYKFGIEPTIAYEWKGQLNNPLNKCDFRSKNKLDYFKCGCTQLVISG